MSKVYPTDRHKIVFDNHIKIKEAILSVEAQVKSAKENGISEWPLKGLVAALDILRKVESGELVEVVRCKDCKYFNMKRRDEVGYAVCQAHPTMETTKNRYCSDGRYSEVE